MKYLYDREGRKTVEVADFVVIGENVSFGPGVRIGAFSLIEDGVNIAAKTVIKPYSHIKKDIGKKKDKTLEKILG
jgi:UDP-3-O-[3-hydroxymyristoyl] glucosamine N-acyltransferase